MPAERVANALEMIFENGSETEIGTAVAENLLRFVSILLNAIRYAFLKKDNKQGAFL